MINEYISNYVIPASDEETGSMMVLAIGKLYKAEPAMKSTVYNDLVFLNMGIELRNPAFFEAHPEHHVKMMESFKVVATAAMNGDPEIEKELFRIAFRSMRAREKSRILWTNE